jgi:hypothetical protein
MTSSAPLTELALQALHDAERGAFMRLDPAALHDLEAARAMTAEERLNVLDALLLRAAAVGHQAPNLKPVRGSDFRM